MLPASKRSPILAGPRGLLAGPVDRRPHVTLLLVLIALAACSPTAPSQREALEDARQRWELREPAEHRYTLQRSCECLVSWAMPMTITVSNGVIQSVEGVAAADDLAPGPDPDAALTIDQLLDQIAEAFDRDAHLVEVTYDPHYGFPRSLYIDFSPPMVDDEFQFTVSNFEPLD